MTAADRVAVVTGGSQGLGAVLASFLAAEGFEVLLTARHEDPLDAVVRTIRATGGRVEGSAGSVADPAHRSEVARWVDRRGRLDLLANNASELGPSPLPPLSAHPLDAFREVLEVNLVAPLALVQQLRAPLARAKGLVVNVSSDAAVGAYPGWGGYGASKAALDLVSRTLARELAGEGISVVSVDPGDMRTAMHQAAFPSDDISDRPLPSVTLPFWAWLLGQEPTRLTGRRFLAQGDRWEVEA